MKNVLKRKTSNKSYHKSKRQKKKKYIIKFISYFQEITEDENDIPTILLDSLKHYSQKRDLWKINFMKERKKNNNNKYWKYFNISWTLSQTSFNNMHGIDKND